MLGNKPDKPNFSTVSWVITAAKLPLRDIGLAIEALKELLLAFILQPKAVYPNYMRGFGELCHSPPVAKEYPSIVREVGRAIRRVERHLPADGTCLKQARAAQRMLRRRGVDVVVYVGVLRDKEGELSAHAWVRNGRLFVTGASGHKQFKVLSMHHKPLPGLPTAAE